MQEACVRSPCIPKHVCVRAHTRTPTLVVSHPLFGQTTEMFTVTLEPASTSTRPLLPELLLKATLGTGGSNSGTCASGKDNELINTPL